MTGGAVTALKLVDEGSRPASGATSRSSSYLHPGQLLVSRDPCEVTTVLGSCVAVCLWDATLRVGGINHYLLPYRVESNQASPRFGNVAIERLINALLALGSRKPRLEAKIFGGASVIPGRWETGGQLGSKNVTVAREVLQVEGTPIVAEDVGGTRARKLVFQTDTGIAWVKHI